MTSQSPDVPQVRFAGTARERGLQRGRRLKETLKVPDLSHLPADFVKGCRDAAAAFYPPVLDEFEGILEGGGFDPRAIEAFYFARLESMLGGCTMAAVTTDEGPLVGRNYDWARTDLRWCELQRHAPADGVRYIGYTHHWAGCPDAMNEAGLYLALASLPPEPVPCPGLQWNILTQMIAETCCAVAEAVAACARIRHLRAMSYLFADAAGDAAVVEATPREVRVRRPSRGLLLVTNVAQGGESAAAWSDTGAMPMRQSAGRWPRSVDRARRRLARARGMIEPTLPGTSAADLARMLRDHEAPICVGDHCDPTGWATIWSGICRPAERDFRIAPGRPCETDYRAFALE